MRIRTGLWVIGIPAFLLILFIQLTSWLKLRNRFTIGIPDYPLASEQVHRIPAQRLVAAIKRRLLRRDAGGNLRPVQPTSWTEEVYVSLAPMEGAYLPDGASVSLTTVTKYMRLLKNSFKDNPELQSLVRVTSDSPGRLMFVFNRFKPDWTGWIKKLFGSAFVYGDPDEGVLFSASLEKGVTPEQVIEAVPHAERVDKNTIRIKTSFQERLPPRIRIVRGSFSPQDLLKGRLQAAFLTTAEPPLVSIHLGIHSIIFVGFNRANLKLQERRYLNELKDLVAGQKLEVSKKGRVMRLAYRRDREDHKIAAEEVARRWGQAGVSVILEPMEKQAYLFMIQQGEFETLVDSTLSCSIRETEIEPEPRLAFDIEYAIVKKEPLHLVGRKEVLNSILPRYLLKDQ